MAEDSETIPTEVEEQPTQEETPASETKEDEPPKEEEPPTEEPPVDDTPPVDSPAEDTPPADPPAEDTPPVDPPTEDTPPTDPPAEDTPPTDPPAEDTPPVIEATPTEEPSGEIEPTPEEPKESTNEEPKVEATPTEPPVPPRTKYYSVSPDDPVELLMGSSGLPAMEAKTVGQFFKDAVSKFGSKPALAFKDDKDDPAWTHITYSEYYDKCVAAAKSFLKLELESFHSVAILGFNSPEWVISAMGAIMAGGLAVGIYATNKPEVCKFIIEDSKADIVVVENDKQLQKILSVREQLPNLKAIIQYKDKLTETYPDVYEWSQFIELGSTIETQVIEDKIAQQKPGCCASIIYTSGTVGNPKGVMLSHDSITWSCVSGHQLFSKYVKQGADRVISYLPLSHIAAQFIDIYFTMLLGGETYFAQPDALKGGLGRTLREVRPTVFFGVPRVWEKIMETIKTLAPPPGSMKSKISTWAKGIGLEGNMNIQKNTSLPWGWTVAGMLLFKKVRERLGFSETTLFGSSAAPIRVDVLEFFMGLNIPICEVYGMSEGCGGVTSNVIEPGRWKAGSVGLPYPGQELKLHETNEQGEGELCYRGRNVMMGYFNNEEKTKETLDEEGWIHSGDLAVVDQNGFYTITGRKKELIITSGGENIAPVPIEDNIKKEIPFISNVMVVGDHRNYLTCILSLKCVMDPETGEPTDDLTPDAARLVAAKGSTATKISQVVDNQDSAVFAAIQEGFDRANESAISNAATVKKWSLLDTDFSESGGELGPTQKLRRFFVAQKYAQTIDGLYAE